jgi:hypothetical protein
MVKIFQIFKNSIVTLNPFNYYDKSSVLARKICNGEHDKEVDENLRKALKKNGWEDEKIESYLRYVKTGKTTEN